MSDNRNLPAAQQAEASTSFNFFDPVQFDTMQRVCKMFASSELVPDMYRATDKVSEAKAMANCMIAIEMAQRIGASPLMIMQNMVIIYGRPSWSSKFLVATVNTCGRYEPLKYKFTNLGKVGKVNYTEYKWNSTVKKKEPVLVEFDGTQLDNIQCIAYTKAKGSDDILESAPISIKLAIQEGWYTKDGSKWKTMQQQMLMYRAASFWTNAYAPELSMGMKTDDELIDIIDTDYEDVSDKVEVEKAKNANKKPITLEPEAPAPDPAPAADPQPEAQQEAQPEAQPQQGQQAEPDKKNPTLKF